MRRLREDERERSFDTQREAFNVDTPADRIAFTVVDPAIPATGVTLRVSVAEGAVEIADVSDASVRIDVSGLAASYTGYLSARDVARLGRVDGATAADLAALDTVFRGPAPYLADNF